MYGKMKEFLAKELADIKAAGLYKNERIITTPQRADIKVNDGEDVLNFCANNYLGLSDNQRLINAAKEAMDTHGFGMSSVRFICGTQDLHKQLEAAISDYFKTEDTILYAACFDANGGLFEPLFTEEDAIISDALNHQLPGCITGHRCNSVHFHCRKPCNNCNHLICDLYLADVLICFYSIRIPLFFSHVLKPPVWFSLPFIITNFCSFAKETAQNISE